MTVAPTRADPDERTEVLPAVRPRVSPPRTPRPPRSARPGREPKPPRPPRRPPRTFAPLSPRQRVVRTVSMLVAVVSLAFVFFLVVVSAVQHAASQQQLSDAFRAQLAEGTAPVSEGDFEGNLLADGAPVAMLEIPAIGVREVVVEGTSASELALGPGHRRDTILPGQQGTSVIYGRAASYGGPFARLQQLPIDSEIIVTTGQGEHTYRVMGIRYAGESTPPPIGTDEGRLVLVSARGLPYIPTGAVFVDAELTSEVEDRGARFTTYATLPPSAKPFASDTSTVWALVFALQFIVLAEILLLWLMPRLDARRAWIVFFPTMLLGGIWAAYQLTLLLPNLL